LRRLRRFFPTRLDRLAARDRQGDVGGGTSCRSGTTRNFLVSLCTELTPFPSQMYDDDFLTLTPEQLVNACRREGILYLIIVKPSAAGGRAVDESEKSLKVKSVLRGYEEEGARLSPLLPLPRSLPIYLPSPPAGALNLADQGASRAVHRRRSSRRRPPRTPSLERRATDRNPRPFSPADGAHPYHR
jgi:hypothetical protein